MSVIDANLTVNSLALLGFNTDEYQELYSGLAKDIPPLSIYSFERENETAFFCCLHFLLCRLDYHDFSGSVEDCWPYINIQTKNDFKYAIKESLDRLTDKNLIDVGQVDFELDFYVRGPAIWQLLRILSDLCVDMAINALDPSVRCVNSITEDSSAIQNEIDLGKVENAVTPVTQDNNASVEGENGDDEEINSISVDITSRGADVPPKKSFRAGTSTAKLLAELEIDAANTMGTAGMIGTGTGTGINIESERATGALVASDDEGDDEELMQAQARLPAGNLLINGMVDLTEVAEEEEEEEEDEEEVMKLLLRDSLEGQVRSDLLKQMDEEQLKVEELVSMHIAKQMRTHEYMEELAGRLKDARQSIEASEKKIRKTMNQAGGLYALTEAGRKFRMNKLAAISSSAQLLQELANSSLLSQARDFLLVEADRTSSPGVHAGSSNTCNSSSSSSSHIVQWPVPEVPEGLGKVTAAAAAAATGGGGGGGGGGSNGHDRAKDKDKKEKPQQQQQLEEEGVEKASAEEAEVPVEAEDETRRIANKRQSAEEEIAHARVTAKEALQQLILSIKTVNEACQRSCEDKLPASE